METNFEVVTILFNFIAGRASLIESIKCVVFHFVRF